MSRLPATLALAAGLLLPAAAVAQSGTALLQRQLATADSLLAAQGYRVSSALSGGTARGSQAKAGRETLSATFRSGVQYIVTGVCDEDCSDLDLAIYAPNSSTVLEADVETDDTPMIAFTASASGSHRVAVTMAACSVEPCSYAVRVYERGGSSSANTASSAGNASTLRCSATAANRALALGSTVSGALGPANCVESDNSHAEYYRLDLPSARTVTLELRSGDFDAYLALHDASGRLLERDDDSGEGTDARITKRLEAGTYYVRANTLRAGATGGYRISASAGAAAERTASPARTTSAVACSHTSANDGIGVGDTRRGWLNENSCRQSDDSRANMYRLDISSSRRVVIDMRSSDFDAFLSIYRADGSSIASNDDGGEGTDARLTLALVPGTYFIAANALSSDSAGAYTLTVR